MISLNDKRKLIKYLQNNKIKLQNILDNFSSVIVELEEGGTVNEVLTKKRLGEIFYINKILLKFFKMIISSPEDFEMEE